MLFKLLNRQEDYLAGMQELLQERGHGIIDAKSASAEDGDVITIEVEENPDDNQLAVFWEGKRAKLSAPRKTFVFRAFMTLVRELEKNGTDRSFEKKETVYLDRNGSMYDCSRNSVLNLETIKRYLRYQAALGMNTMMLYTEDTYEVPEYPYFGAFRGRYTREELMECDAYAALFGIEIVPCIQTLAHLKTALRWPAMMPLQDTDYILMVGEEKVYQFIEACIRAATEPFRSRRVHLGMDEAWHLGLGNYLLQNGYHTKAEIMTEHLEKVAAICRKLGLEPMIWSDMYLRMNSPASEYYDVPLDSDLSDAVKPPEGMGLVYWDYYHDDPEFYASYLRMHRQLSDRVVFAGGGWVWNGLAPALSLAFKNTEAAMAGCKADGVKEAVCTMWQDNGAETPMAAGLISLILFAEHGFCVKPEQAQLKEQFEFLTGSSYEAYLLLGEFDRFPGGNGAANPTKYLFYQDPMMGLFDGQIKGKEAGEHYRVLAKRLQQLMTEQGQEDEPVLRLYLALAKALTIKADLGNRLCQAYQAKDRETLKEIGEQEIPLCMTCIREYKELREQIWNRESKIFGFEVLDIRISGLLGRLETAGKRLQAYLNGEVSDLPELAQERLIYHPRTEREPYTLGNCNLWDQIVSASLI